MSTAQKIIKYLAIGFAIFLIVTIIYTIMVGVYSLAKFLGISKSTQSSSEINLSIDEINDLPNYLDIDLAYTDLEIKTGDKFEISSNNNIEYKQDGEKLIVKEKKSNVFLKDDSKKTVIVIPNNFKFEKTKFELGAGKVNIEKLENKKLELSLGAGKTEIKEINCDEFTKIETGSGKFEIQSGVINNLDFEIGAGSTSLNVKLVGKNKIKAGIGKLNMNLQESIDSYSFKVSKGIGKINIDGKDIINDNTTIGNGKNFIDIEGGIGKVDICFNK